MVKNLVLTQPSESAKSGDATQLPLKKISFAPGGMQRGGGERRSSGGPPRTTWELPQFRGRRLA